jgi:uncharacterized damage-inducible protein DinB
MSEAERIAKLLRRACSGRAWHGPSVEEALAGVSAEIAAAPSPGGAHSIWQIVAHIAAWEAAVGRWLAGDMSRPSTAEEWPTIEDASETAWQALLQRLRSGNEKLCGEIAQLSDARLDEPIFEKQPRVYSTLHGLVQHAVYHAGQISLLKKMHG